MSQKCFLSFKKEDVRFKEKIITKLGKERIRGKALDKWIDSDDIDYVMRVIRKEYMSNTSVTIFIIGDHSSENEGKDINGDKNAFIKKELQATLYDGKGFRRSGLLGVVLPSMESKIFQGRYICEECGETHEQVNISNETVIKEFSKNYFLNKDESCCYTAKGRFCVLVRYSEFMNDPDKYIDQAYEKLNEPIAKEVHWRDLR